MEKKAPAFEMMDDQADSFGLAVIVVVLVVTPVVDLVVDLVVVLVVALVVVLVVLRIVDLVVLCVVDLIVVGLFLFACTVGTAVADVGDLDPDDVVKGARRCQSSLFAFLVHDKETCAEQ